ncbi:amino acid adenylation domain-containing protein [Thermoflavimicrobium dichotomicum]|uniref:Non-ribosomal peptide synthase domain TIGR01720/amino acid adenylation domain-containing protein n=1 Tax=Thermoflavimicrobium dichotomicum TaxID=46223 RepID=A0A1I3T237_9BACL|nr:non-ribosomal peptide synthetase [Thermoflavimicrobium dichotomicum]SFJ64582.1 non-ribosomal peptide synthase domain TIGR01720/amino acid adenylation domain-containing protein [Thermoflavimicrobium dichotomicum]
MMEEIQDIYTLSPLQQGLLFHSVYAENSGMYFTQMAVTIKGSLNVDAFEQAWQQVVDRHTILRTGFIWGETEQPVQVVYRKSPVKLHQLDWRHLPPAEKQRKLAEWMEQDRMQDFDITVAPLMRLNLIQTEEQTYEFVWGYHHVLLDGWSLPIVLNEVFQSYDALVKGKKLNLPTPRPYRDYIAWLRKQDMKKAEAYWRESLKGFTSPTPLVVNEPTGETGYHTLYRTLSPSITEKLHRLAREHQVTVNTIVQGAWAILLHRYSGEQEVLYGATVSGRPTELIGVEQMVGLFINTLPVRVQVPTDLPLVAWLKQLQAQQVELRQYEYSSLIDIHGWSEAPRGTPLFHSLFVYENYPIGESTSSGMDLNLELGNIRAVEQTHYPLSLVCAPGKEMLLKMMYDRSQFTEKTVEQILTHVSNLLEQMVTDLEMPVGKLSLLTPAEQQKILTDWNRTALDYPRSMMVHQLVEAQAERTPQQTAVVWGDESLTYQELNQRANQVAHYLKGFGVGPETLVGICMERSLDLVIGLLGILKAGGAYVPLDPAYPRERIAYMLEDSGIRVLLTQASLKASLPLERVQAICLDADRELICEMSTQDVEHEGSPFHRSHVIYTSGSTGKPKGVMIEHRSVVALLAWARQVFTSEELQGVLAATSICFDLSVFEIFLPLSAGGTVILAENALQLPELPAKEQVTLINTVPSAATELVRIKGIPRSVRVVNLAGEPLSNTLAQQLYRLGHVQKVYNLYGPSEDTTYSTYALVERGAATSPPIGRPIANTEAYVLDQELRPVPVGVPGELYLGGEGLARGYMNRPDLTNERFVPHPFREDPKARLYKTGDLVRWLPDGKLAFLGRLDHQVKIRGFRIELGEIEEVLRLHPMVKDAAVIAREDQPGEKRLVAYLVLTNPVEVNSGEWRSHLKQHLPDYMVPAAFVVLEALPLTPNGKVDHKALPAPEQGTQDNYVAPRTETEQIVADIWASVLKVDQVGLTGHFFELGGHSLLATQVISRLRESLDMEEIPLRILFEKPTVMELAAWLDGQAHKDAVASMPITPVSRDEGMVPVSYAQQRLWFIEQLISGSSAYSLPFALKLTGHVEIEALEQSFRTLIERHQSLRTTFAEVDGEILQVIHEHMDWLLPFFDLRDEKEPVQRAQEMIEQHVAHPFDLKQGPLIRASLFRLSEQEWVLFVNMHHIVSDGWSMSIFQQELFSLYNSLVKGETLHLRDLPIQYADYAVWQRKWLQNEVMEQQLAYWKEKLGGELPVLHLPTDRPRPAEQTFHGAMHTVALSPELTEQLKQLSQQEEATLFMTLLAAFQTLLSRYSRQEDVIVGSPIAGRNRQETEGLIGFFVNTLAFRTDLSGNPSFRELLARVRQTALEAFAHQDVPFEKVVDELQPERSLSHSALFQVMFVLQNMPFTAQSLAGLELAPFDFTHVTAKFDITLTMMETEEGLMANFEYNTDLFDAATIARMAGHFRQLLEGIVQNPDQAIGYLPMLTSTELEQLQRWNQTQVEYPCHASIADVFAEQAEKTPEAIALVFENETLTYQELNQRANQLAHFLRKQGVGLETLVGVAMERSLDLIVTLLAIAKAGGAYVPLDPTYPMERLAYMMQDAKVKLVLTESRLQAQLPLQSDGVIVLDQYWEQIARESRENPLPLAKGEHLAYVMYTSGSTGKPKGVEVVHRAILRLVKGANYVDIRQDDVFLQLAPVAFDASTFEIWGSLLNGARLVIMPPHTPSLEEIAQVLKEARVTTLWLTVGLFNLMVEHQLSALKGLRQLLVGGDVVSVPHVQKVLALGGVQVISCYGPTENTTFTSCYPIPADWQGGTSVPIGRPISNTDVYILDPHGQPVPIGVPGELYTGGDGLARGYLNRPDLTAERFVPHPFSDDPHARLYRTGDLVRYLPDGNIEFLGRLDHQVKIRGFRIELGEVEAAIRQHPAVKETVVIVDQSEAGKRLVAYVVADCLVAELRAFVKQRLPEYMVPAGFLLLDEMPLTENGKIDRKALPKPDPSTFSGEKEYVAPRNKVEASLAEIWREVLRVDQVGIHDNFFHLGGDSILSIQIVSRAKQAGLHLTPKQIFENQTIAELAQVVDETTVIMGEQGLVCGEVPLLPVQHWFFEQERVNPHHFNQAIMFSVDQPLPIKWMKETVKHLLYHHDALRLRYKRQGETWHQYLAEPEEGVPFVYHDLRNLNASLQKERIEQIANQVQASLDFINGPVFQVVYFDLGEQEPDRLLFVAHHLVVDGVSWRILLEDFQTVYEQLSQFQTVRLPAKTTSYKEWAEQLRRYAQTEEVKAELAYWQAAPQEISEIPVDFHEGANTEGSAEYIHVALTPAETQALLKQVPAIYRTQVQEVLLTALVRSLASWTRQSTVWIDLEGHGREEIVEGVDLSRTVGWFTSVYPVCLTIEPHGSLTDSLKQVKEMLRQIPRRGIGYGLLRYLHEDKDVQAVLSSLPQPEISFNYLGQFDQMDTPDALLRGASESVGSAIDPGELRTYLLEITGMVSGGQLVVTWKYSKEKHHRQTIEAIAQQFIHELQSILAEQENDSGQGFTPSDFPLANITSFQLDQLFEEYPEIENIYVATPLQQGMLFHSLYAAEKGDYITQIAFTLQGKLDIDLFQQAWQKVVDRHPVLRTSFQTAGLSEPHQLVHRSVPVELIQLDWSRWSPAEQNERLQAFLEADRRQGFDFSEPPLMRWYLIRLAEDSYRFIWTHHHILLDGWSLSLVLKEVFTCYFQRDEQEMDWTASPAYEQYLAWLKKQPIEAAESYWREKLKGFTEPTKIALSESKEIHEPQREQRICLNTSQMNKLKELAQRNQLTLNTVVQGAWALVLSRLSGETDIVYGVTSSGRPGELAEVDTMVGLFISTLPIRVQLPGESSFLEWLRQLQENQMELKSYEYTPLIHIQGWSEMPRGVPLFETLFIFENYPIQAVETAGDSELAITDLYAHEQNNFPLTVVTGPGEELLIKIMYDPAHYTDEAIARILRYLETVLDQIVLAPERKLSDISILPEEEQRQVLSDWNQPPLVKEDHATIPDLFTAQAEQTPSAIAVEWRGQQWTYQELDQRVNQLAHYLQQLGVEPESLVGICMERSFDLIVAILGVLKAGGAYIPLDPNYPAERISYMLQHSKAKVVITQSSLGDRIPGGEIQTICLDEKWPEIAAHDPGEELVIDIQPEHCAYVIYTSGSTGLPKGVVIEHRSVLALIRWAHEAYSLEELQGVLFTTSICFDLSVYELFVPLTMGGTVILAESALELPQLTTIQPITLINTVPSIMTEVLRLTTLPETVRTVNLCGEPLSQALVEKLYAIETVEKVVNLYGPTEDTVYSSVEIVEKGLKTAPPIGRPIRGTQMYVLDAHLQPVPVGVPGELYIAGSGLARGYLHQPELTGERFIANPFSREAGAKMYKTGDLVRWNEQGVLEFMGRIDHQVKVRGFRIELGEIETVLAKHEAIQEAVVVARDDRTGSKQLVAYLILESGYTHDANMWRNYLQKKLPDYMIPAVFIEMDAFPQTPNGKIDRKALPAPEMGSSVKTYEPPRTETERQLVKMWEEVLSVRPIGIHDSFFEVGGHSLVALQLVSMIQERFQVDLPLRALLTASTIAELAKEIEADHPVTNRHLIPLHSAQDDQPVIFMIHPQGGGVMPLYELAQRLGEVNVYGIQSIGYDTADLPLTSVQEMAERYVHEIRQVQPHGPYHLAGWSLGGVIAFEMTRRLEAAGEQVAWLGLIDTTWIPQEQKAKFLQLLTDPLVLREQAQLLDLDPSEMLQQVEVDELTPEHVANKIQHLTHSTQRKAYIWLLNGLAYAEYEIRYKINANIHLFVAQEKQWLSGSYEWQPYTAGQVYQVTISGNHITMLERPHVETLAAEIRKSGFPNQRQTPKS